MAYWHNICIRYIGILAIATKKPQKALIDFSPIENKGIVNEKPPKPIRIGMKAFLL